jgi:hypothetical protein
MLDRRVDRGHCVSVDTTSMLRDSSFTKYRPRQNACTAKSRESLTFGIDLVDTKCGQNLAVRKRESDLNDGCQGSSSFTVSKIGFCLIE